MMKKQFAGKERALQLQIATTWLLLVTLAPTVSFGANQEASMSREETISLADSGIMKRVISHYNGHREIGDGFHGFLQANLSAEDYQYTEQALKNRRSKQLPIAAISGNRIVFQGSSDALSIERQADGKILISSGQFRLLTTEKKALSDLIQQMRHPKKDLLSQAMNLMIPEAHAFFMEAADAIASIGGVLYSYWEVTRDTVKDKVQDWRANEADKPRLEYLRSARDNVYSCQKSKDDWNDNWFQRSFKDREGTIRKIADHFDDRSKLNDSTVLQSFKDESSLLEKQVQITSQQIQRDCTGQEAKIAEGNPKFEISPAGDSRKIYLSSDERENLCENLKKRLDCLVELKGIRTSYVNSYYPGASTELSKATREQAPAAAANRSPAVLSATVAE
jgi:hypothetical protein